jgi:DNA polymerase-3 subunit delta'
MSAVRYAWHAAAWRQARSAVARGAHALLITGASGLGKGEFALAFAASYLCGRPDQQGRACRACESCRWLEAGTHPDFMLVERPTDEEESPRAAAAARAKPIGVDQIRALGELLSLSAHHAAGKAIVIRPADALNPTASNALLKNLEEPPPGILFLLVTDRPALLLPTVRSRCQSIAVHLDDPRAAAAWLEERGIDEPALPLALAGGAPLAAAAIAVEPSWERRRNFLAALASSASEPLRTAEAMRDLPPALMLAWLQTWTYDLLAMRSCARIRYHIDMQAQIVGAAAIADPIRLSRLYRTLCSLRRHVNHPLNARLFIEHMLIEYAHAMARAEAA